MTPYLIAIGLCLLMACQSSETDPQLKRAFEVHQAALLIHDSLENELSALQAQSLTPEDEEERKRLQEASTQWETNLVEVPGFDHAEGHDHNHDHSHHHDPINDALQNLPPAEILKLQQALLEEAKRLLDETRNLASRRIQASP